MAIGVRRLLIVFLLLASWSLARPSPGQYPPPPADAVLPPPRSFTPSTPPATSLGPPTVPANPAPFPYGTAPPPPQPPDAQNPIYQPNDPGPAGWGPYQPPSMPSHFFAYHEVDILKPHLKAALSNNVTLANGSSAQVQPPTAQPGWTGAPAFEVGWFLPNSLGYFAFNYRGFADQVNTLAAGLDATTYALRTRLDLNQLNFDYGVAPYTFAPHWSASGRIGIGLADVFFDNRAQNAVLTQYASNNFLGAGPHVRFQVSRHIGFVPGLDLFGRADLVVLVGQIHQNYVQANVAPDGSTTQASTFLRKTQTVPNFSLQAGLSYVPPSWDTLRFSVGYMFEEFWFVGQIDGLDPRGQFSTNGVFLRGEKSF